MELDYDMEEFNKCLDIVDVIIKEGGYGTVRIFLASVMLENNDVYEYVLNECRIDGKKVKELIYS